MASSRNGILAVLATLAVLGSISIATAQDSATGPSGDAEGLEAGAPPVILYLELEGATVHRGDLIGEMDTTALRTELADQEIAAQQAEAAHKNAERTLEVAWAALIEYLDGTFKQEITTLKGEIALAGSELRKAVDKRNWSERMKDKGYVPVASYTADVLALQKANFMLEQAQTKLNVLQKYTKGKILKEYQSEVNKAVVAEADKQADLEQARTKREAIREQIERCRIVAPSDGRLILRSLPEAESNAGAP